MGGDFSDNDEVMIEIWRDTNFVLMPIKMGLSIWRVIRKIATKDLKNSFLMSNESLSA